MLADPFRGPKVPGVIYEMEPVKDGLFSKLRRLNTYYKTDLPKRRIRDPPDISIVESLDLLGMHQHGKDVPLILHEGNVYWELLRYEMINSPFFRTWLGRRGLVRRWLIPHLMKRAKAFEIAALRRATRTMVPSETDRDRILTELPELKGRICIFPNCIDKERIPYSNNPVETKNVVFVGDYNYIPNQEAAMYVSRHLGPALPDAKFQLVGPHPPSDNILEDNVVFTGFVEDLQSMLETAAVCIAPLVHGSGTRFKILTYLAAGKAVVATTKACEGLEVRDGVHLLLRDDPDGFQLAVRNLLNDYALRRRLGMSGRELVEQKYDWRAYVQSMREFVGEVLAGR